MGICQLAFGPSLRFTSSRAVTGRGEIEDGGALARGYSGLFWAFDPLATRQHARIASNNRISRLGGGKCLAHPRGERLWGERRRKDPGGRHPRDGREIAGPAATRRRNAPQPGPRNAVHARGFFSVAGGGRSGDALGMAQVQPKEVESAAPLSNLATERPGDGRGGDRRSSCRAGEDTL